MKKEVLLTESGLRSLRRNISDCTIEDFSFQDDGKTLVIHFDDDSKVLIETDNIKNIALVFQQWNLSFILQEDSIYE